MPAPPLTCNAPVTVEVAFVVSVTVNLFLTVVDPLPDAPTVILVPAPNAFTVVAVVFNKLKVV